MNANPFSHCRRGLLILPGTVLLIAARAGAQPAAEKDQARWLQEKLLVTFWSPPPTTDDALTQVAKERFTLTWSGESGLDACASRGLKAMLTHELLDPTALDDPARREKLGQLVERVKRHPALEAYFIVDEPGEGAFPALGRLVAFLRERDPRHFAYINLFPTYATEAQLGVSAEAADRARVGLPQNFAGAGTTERTSAAYLSYLQKFVEVVKPDLISYDHYHFLKNGDGDQYFLNLALVRSVAIANGKPFLNIIQASTVEPTWRLPGPAELRFLVYTTLAYGGRGISYFTYWGPEAYGGVYRDGNPGPLVESIARLNGEIEKLGPTLLALDSIRVTHTGKLPLGTEAPRAEASLGVSTEGELVIGSFGDRAKGATSAFLIVNRSYKTPTELTLKPGPGIQALEELDRETGEWKMLPVFEPGKPAKVQILEGDGRLFRLVR